MQKRSLFTIILVASVCSLAACTQQQEAGLADKPLHYLSEQASQYAQPSASNTLAFPQEHLPHKDYRHEWWYLTANLVTQEGQALATQWTLFRTSLGQHHWYFAHAALADTIKHQSAFRQGREELRNVSISPSPFAMAIDDWSWQSKQEFLPASLEYGQPGHAETWQVQMQLEGENKFYLQGEQGYSRKHPVLPIASHYYSQPFIKVSGRVFWQGKWQAVSGTAWFDREWGSQMLAKDQQGWDWFSLHLTNDLALMIYRIRSTESEHLYGSLMSRDGSMQTLAKEDISIIAKQSGTSPYPSGFSLELVKESIRLDVNIVNQKQIMRFGIDYFEGMVEFSGSYQGKGFVEMTGY